MGLLLTAS